ncbi:MAG TPA: sigma-70 family RNA polymerase sigma factor [Candidatus Binatia bacterium]|nr:sigma-70 family RNA polymerase sigma factor [Candidatus Binatia bacterium]
MTEAKSDWIQAALREHEGALVRYAAQFTGDLDRARDVVQDTFLRLCGEDHAQLDGHLTQWLFTVCRNRALDIQRKEQRMKPLNDEELATRPGSEVSPAALAERNESRSHVLRLLKDLPSNQREVVRLKFQNGLSYKEIAGVTNLSVSNV